MSKSLKILIIAVFMLFSALQAVADTSVIAPRIIGGTEAVDGEFPFQVAIAEDNGLTYSVFCGGTIISDTWILTAAHCMADYDTAPEIAKLRIISGTNDITDLTNYTSVSQVIVHADYNDVTYDNDIALIELSSAITAAPVDHIANANAPYFTVGTRATVSGWGEQTGYNVGDYPTLLRKVNVPVISNNICNDSYGTITSNQLCAGYVTGGYDSCQGDSGGPLFVQNDDDTFTLIGVVSFGNGCAAPDYYGVYTRVSRYETWIETNTGLSVGSDTVITPVYPFGMDDVADSSSYDVDITTYEPFIGTFDDSGDTVSTIVNVFGGAIESLTVEDSSENLESLYVTVAKIAMVIDTDGDKDVAVALQYVGADPNDYYIIKCLGGVESMLSCGVDENTTYSNSDGWIRFYLANNSLAYDSNLNIAGDDKIDTTVYLARDYNTGDLVDLVTGGGGGCSATGSGSAFSFIVMLGFCGAYFVRRRLAVKKN